jgi:hypothetical protein
VRTRADTTVDKPGPLRRLLALYEEAYHGPQRRLQARRARREDDLLRVLALSEALGLPNPASFYTLELLPFLLEDYHHWHRRMGLERSPLEGFRCC